MNANLRNFALWVIIVLLLLALFTLFQNPGQRSSSSDVSFSQLLTEVDKGNVRDVVIQGPEIHGTFNNGTSFQTYAPSDPTLVKRLYDAKVQITAKAPGDNVPWFVSLLVSWLPFIALIGVWIFLSRQMQGGAGKAMGFGKSRARLLTQKEGKVTFDDVAGIDEAREKRLNELGIKTYREIEKMAPADEAALEQRLEIAPGTVAGQGWREQAALLRAGNEREHAEKFG